MTESMINGVDVGAVQNVLGKIEVDSSAATCKFRLHNRWESCGENTSSISNFYAANTENSHKSVFKLNTDEPEMLAGSDLAPNPVEYLLHALVSCVTNTLVYHAALKGIRIHELESEVEGDLDLRGFLGMSDKVRKGYDKISINFKVKTDDGNIEILKALSKFSPVYDVVTKGTEVNIKLESM